ncbi:hypothetical protein FS749_010919, partial [Ceratobasidium sp. UAMH 11750]
LNVLVNDNGAPMLTDFGNAVLQDCTLNFTATTRKHSLSLRWAAPELLDEREGTYSQEADVYALGMTVLETFTGQVPYSDKSDLRVITTVMVLKEPPTRPEAHIPSDSRNGDALWSLLKRCWANEPRERPKASDVAKIVKYHWDGRPAKADTHCKVGGRGQDPRTGADPGRKRRADRITVCASSAPAHVIRTPANPH